MWLLVNEGLVDNRRVKYDALDASFLFCYLVERLEGATLKGRNSHSL